MNGGEGRPDGRPCLIRTTFVAQSEMIIDIMAKHKVNTELLNDSPKNAARVGEIISQAGRAGIVTVATNSAERGTDILLGGCRFSMARLKARSML